MTFPSRVQPPPKRLLFRLAGTLTYQQRVRSRLVIRADCGGSETLPSRRLLRFVFNYNLAGKRYFKRWREVSHTFAAVCEMQISQKKRKEKKAALLRLG